MASSRSRERCSDSRHKQLERETRRSQTDETLRSNPARVSATTSALGSHHDHTTGGRRPSRGRQSRSRGRRFYTHSHSHICIYICTHTNTHIYVYVCILYIYIYIYIYLYVYIYIYIYMTYIAGADPRSCSGYRFFGLTCAMNPASYMHRSIDVSVF